MRNATRARSICPECRQPLDAASVARDRQGKSLGRHVPCHRVWDARRKREDWAAMRAAKIAEGGTVRKYERRRA